MYVSVFLSCLWPLFLFVKPALTTWPSLSLGGPLDQDQEICLVFGISSPSQPLSSSYLRHSLSKPPSQSHSHSQILYKLSFFHPPPLCLLLISLKCLKSSKMWEKYWHLLFHPCFVWAWQLPSRSPQLSGHPINLEIAQTLLIKVSVGQRASCFILPHPHPCHPWGPPHLHWDNGEKTKTVVPSSTSLGSVWTNWGEKNAEVRDIFLSPNTFLELDIRILALLHQPQKPQHHHCITVFNFGRCWFQHETHPFLCEFDNNLFHVNRTHLLSTLHILSLVYPHINPMRRVLLSFLLCSWGNWGRERWSEYMADLRFKHRLFVSANLYSWSYHRMVWNKECRWHAQGIWGQGAYIDGEHILLITQYIILCNSVGCQYFLGLKQKFLPRILTL